MTILYIPVCLYILWANYSRIYANSPQQKITLAAYLASTSLLLMISEATEIFNNPQTTIFHLSNIYIYIILVTIAINILNVMHLVATIFIQENTDHIIFITNNMLIHHEHTPTPLEETLANEHIQHMIHQSGDIIVVGQKSPIHAILTERCAKFPHDRTILEQHLYHLSCQVPLIYLTPSGNYIPKTPPTAA